MAANMSIPQRRLHGTHLLRVEAALLKKHYDFLTTKIVNGVLFVYGYCKPSDYSSTYNYKVVYDPFKTPKVYVTEPQISYNEEIHMYVDDNRLCLYYPRDHSWIVNSRLFDTIIPWTHKWFLFYELYLITGKWEHPFVEHRRI